MSLSRIQDLVRGKDVLLVGNNLTALQIEQGEFIDSYDIIVRFGKGCPTGYEKFLGHRTDIWVTGHFRRGSRHLFPKDVEVLYNPGTLRPEAEFPSYEHTVMYSLEEVNEINKYYGQVPDRRLSGGALTAHWFTNVVKEYKSLSFINFDFFHNATVFMCKKFEMETLASSWHLPLIHPRFKTSTQAHDHPAHSLDTERRLFDDVLKDPKAVFIGKLPETHKLIHVENAAWDETRQKIEDKK